MPQYLRKDTIRLFEAALESLNLALIGLAVPIRRDFRSNAARYAAEAGLIGVAAELAMTGCLVHSRGKRAVYRANGMYKTGQEILDDFKTLLGSPTPASIFLTSGVGDTLGHLQELLHAVERFRLLVTARAGALHGGVGPAYDVCIALAEDVAAFLALLQRSDRIATYLDAIPRPPQQAKMRVVLLDELVSEFAQASDIGDQSRALMSLFLVLPDLPPIEPQWLSALERIAVAPIAKDISLLLDCLHVAAPVSLRKVKGKLSDSSEPLPVVIRPEDPNALPISPEWLRTQFNKPIDQWRADIGSANGRLEQNGALDLPPADFVRNLFATGLESAGIARSSDEKFTAHEIWPFVAASLAVQGTAGPYWFLVRRCSDLPQLRAQLERAAQVKNAHLRRNLAEAVAGVDSIAGTAKKAAQSHTPLAKASSKVEAASRSVAAALKRSVATKKVLSDELAAAVLKVADGSVGPGEVIHLILKAPNLNDAVRHYWLRILCEAATDEDDLAGIMSVLRAAGETAVHTAAKLAMRVIDYRNHGPRVE